MTRKDELSKIIHDAIDELNEIYKGEKVWWLYGEVKFDFTAEGLGIRKIPVKTKRRKDGTFECSARFEES